MSEKKEESLYWRRLDNSAKIFPISAGKKYSTVFRLSVLLKEKVNKEILEKAVIQTLNNYNMFRVKMKAGFFWYYLEYNPKEPIIEEEKDYPCKYIDPKTNNGYLFKITYFENKINIDIFHALTDGNTGTTFFREIIYNYLELYYPNELKQENRQLRKIDFDTEDSYIKNYDKSVIHEIINLENLKIESKKYDATITQYLTAVLMYSIYKENYIKNKSKKPIKICIPVNLKRYFYSKTMTNFFSYITLVAQIEKDKLNTFEKMISFVKKEFKNRLNEEEIIKTMSTNVKIGNNLIVRTIPLFLKKILVRLSYLEIRKYTTITFSNIGRVGIIGEYKKYIDYFLMLIAPEPVEKIKCSSCTFENNMVFTFTSILGNNKIEKAFYNFLKGRGIQVKIESNGVLDDIS